jgi:DNA-binding transcriptional MerR regulator
MTHRIGSISKQLGLSVDTLRYYEKIGLLRKIHRTSSGIRLYNDKDISRLKFIRRAQAMNFSLAEIADLLQMREDPQNARNVVRKLTHRKLREIEERLEDLKTLRDELTLLSNLCAGSEEGCPIIEGIENDMG